MGKNILSIPSSSLIATYAIFFFRYILFVRKNALQILIPKYGLEGTIYLSGKKEDVKKSEIEFIYNEEVYIFRI